MAPNGSTFNCNPTKNLSLSCLYSEHLRLGLFQRRRRERYVVIVALRGGLDRDIGPRMTSTIGAALLPIIDVKELSKQYGGEAEAF